MNKELPYNIKDLPYTTAEIKGIGGELKVDPEHFIVTEKLAYDASGIGQHIYVTIKRQNMNTQDVLKLLKHAFKIHERDIGKAGLKDKNATTTQTFSLSLGSNFELAKAEEIINKIEGIELLSISRHTNKIKTGHLTGNHFEIVLNGAQANEEQLNILVEKISKGIPNYYGEQRFGSKGTNHQIGALILKGEKKMNHHLSKLMLSSLQSKLFNDYLKLRIKRYGLFCELEGEVSFSGKATGPMFGKKMLMSTGASFELENEVLKHSSLDRDQISGKHLEGSRRELIMIPEQLSAISTNDGVKLSFFLKKGCYATIVVREFSKC